MTNFKHGLHAFFLCVCACIGCSGGPLSASPEIMWVLRIQTLVLMFAQKGFNH